MTVTDVPKLNSSSATGLVMKLARYWAHFQNTPQPSPPDERSYRVGGGGGGVKEAGFCCGVPLMVWLFA